MLGLIQLMRLGLANDSREIGWSIGARIKTVVCQVKSSCL